jgi:hypothetical protein
MSSTAVSATTDLGLSRLDRSGAAVDVGAMPVWLPQSMHRSRRPRRF